MVRNHASVQALMEFMAIIYRARWSVLVALLCMSNLYWLWTVDLVVWIYRLHSHVTATIVILAVCLGWVLRDVGKLWWGFADYCKTSRTSGGADFSSALERLSRVYNVPMPLLTKVLVKYSFVPLTTDVTRDILNFVSNEVSSARLANAVWVDPNPRRALEWGAACVEIMINEQPVELAIGQATNKHLLTQRAALKEGVLYDPVSLSKVKIGRT
jgi:hypothetical protein